MTPQHSGCRSFQPQEGGPDNLGLSLLHKLAVRRQCGKGEAEVCVSGWGVCVWGAGSSPWGCGGGHWFTRLAPGRAVTYHS